MPCWTTYSHEYLPAPAGSMPLALSAVRGRMSPWRLLRLGGRKHRRPLARSATPASRGLSREHRERPADSGDPQLPRQGPACRPMAGTGSRQELRRGCQPNGAEASKPHCKPALTGRKQSVHAAWGELQRLPAALCFAQHRVTFPAALRRSKKSGCDSCNKTRSNAPKQLCTRNAIVGRRSLAQTLTLTLAASKLAPLEEKTRGRRVLRQHPSLHTQPFTLHQKADTENTHPPDTRDYWNTKQSAP
jgi:hypothetical protein